MPEPFSLAGRAWLPVALRSGQRKLVRLCEISSSDVASLATGRPDCDIALAEFLIGLLGVTLSPDDTDAWVELYNSPPSCEVLKAAFAPFADALVLDGAGPRFFQDFTELSGDETAVEALFIDAPADHFMVDKRFEALSRAGAAIALLTLQTMAPSGGAGHRTSLRGGGPLTTLVVPRGEPTLWQSLWANVPQGLAAGPDVMKLVFPWLASTRTSNPKENGEITTPPHVHEAQAFFGMPRRIRLTFEQNSEDRACDLLGAICEPDEIIVRSYITRPWGTNYPSNTWRHPLSPYYKQKNTDTEMLPQHLKSARVGFREWLGLVTGGGLKTRAEVVALFRNERARLIREKGVLPRLKVAGFALDNMKPLEFAESLLPLFSAGNPTANSELDTRAAGMVEAAEMVASQLSSAVRRALYGEKAKVDSDSTVLSSVTTEFWTETEAPFFAQLAVTANDVANAVEADTLTDERGTITAKHAPPWLKALTHAALDIFDATVSIEDSDPERLADVIEARKQLSLMLKGYGKLGEKLFAALGVAVPQRKAPRDNPDKSRGRKPRSPAP